MIKNKLILMLCAIGIAFSMSTKVSASNNTQRIWGNDRYATAIEVSKNGWVDGSEYVVLANGENFPDALAAKNSSAIVLVNNNAEQTTKDFMFSNITPKCKTNILGGNGVIPTELINDVLSLVGNTRDILNEKKKQVMVL
jgi:putative cell wall-binding protein